MSDLILTTGTKFEIALAPEAEALKLAALADAKTILAVRDDFAQQAAVDSLKGLRDISKQVEKSRKDAKSPALEFGKKVDDLARRFCVELETEAARITGLITPYEAEKRRLAAIEEEKRQAEARRLVEEQRRVEAEERKKLEAAEAELAKARNAKAREEAAVKLQAQKVADEARWKADQERLRSLPTEVKADKTVGQVVRDEWEFSVVDIHALYAFDKSLVRLEENRSAINVKIGSGAREIPGLRIQKAIKIGTR